MVYMWNLSIWAFQVALCRHVQLATGFSWRHFPEAEQRWRVWEATGGKPYHCRLWAPTAMLPFIGASVLTFWPLDLLNHRCLKWLIQRCWSVNTMRSCSSRERCSLPIDAFSNIIRKYIPNVPNDEGLGGTHQSLGQGEHALYSDLVSPQE